MSLTLTHSYTTTSLSRVFNDPSQSSSGSPGFSHLPIEGRFSGASIFAGSSVFAAGCQHGAKYAVFLKSFFL